MKVPALTTIDNPYNPVTQYDLWRGYDTTHGRDTSAYLARFARTSTELSTADNYQAIEDAIDEIVKHNPLQIYKKVLVEV